MMGILSSVNWAIVKNDVFAAAFSFAICQFVIALVQQKFEQGLIDVHLVRKLVHVCIGLVPMLCCPMYSSGWCGAVSAGLVPSFCLVRPFILNNGIYNTEKLLKFATTRYRDDRELLKAALGYVSTIAVVTICYWRTSPIAIAAISNLCAGDGAADIIGRRFGNWKLPYNKNKSFAGSMGMVLAGFLTSIGYMYYFSWLGYIQGCTNMIQRFLLVSIAAAFVESNPISTIFDDNFTVPMASMFVGAIIFHKC